MKQEEKSLPSWSLHFSGSRDVGGRAEGKHIKHIGCQAVMILLRKIRKRGKGVWDGVAVVI